MKTFYFYKPPCLSKPFGAQALCYGAGQMGLALYETADEALQRTQQNVQDSSAYIRRNICALTLRALPQDITPIEASVPPKVLQRMDALNRAVNIRPLQNTYQASTTSWFLAVEWLKTCRSPTMVGQILAHENVLMLDARVSSWWHIARGSLLLTHPGLIETVHHDLFDATADTLCLDLRARPRQPVPRSWDELCTHYTIHDQNNLSGGGSLYTYLAENHGRKTYLKEASRPESTMEQYIVLEMARVIVEAFGIPGAQLPTARLIVGEENNPILLVSDVKGKNKDLSLLMNGLHTGRALEAIAMMACLLAHDDFASDQFHVSRDNVALIDFGGTARCDWANDPRPYPRRLNHRSYWDKFKIPVFDGGHLSLDDKIGMMTRLVERLPQVLSAIQAAGRRIDALGLCSPAFDQESLRQEIFVPFVARVNRGLRILETQKNLFHQRPVPLSGAASHSIASVG